MPVVIVNTAEYPKFTQVYSRWTGKIHSPAKFLGLALKEVERFTEMKKGYEIQKVAKNIFGGMMNEEEQEKKVRNDFYDITIKSVETKRILFENVLKGLVPEGTLEELQENLSDWLDAVWAYKGMENVIDLSEAAKLEFGFCKNMCMVFKPHVEKPKKKRKGKKGRGRR